MAMLVVPSFKFASLEKKLNRIIRKCEKAKVPYTYEVSEPFKTRVTVRYFNKEDHTYFDKDQDMTCVSVNLDLCYHIEGWEVLGVVMEKCGVKQTYFNDAFLCDKFKGSDINYCDHCHTHRRRNSIVILRDSNGNIKKVGSSCCQEFTHGIDGSLCSEFCGIYGELLSIDVNYHECVEDSGNYSRDCMSCGVRTLFIVTLANYIIANHGYVSVNNAQSFFGRTSTADRLYDLLKDNVYSIINHSIHSDKSYIEYTVDDMLNAIGIEMNHGDIDFANKALEWCKNLTNEECTSSYLYNLREICRTDTISGFAGVCGMLASLIPTYQKYLREKMEKEAIDGGNYVAEIGQRISAIVTLKDFRTYNAYDFRGGEVVKKIYTFDFNGNTLVWFTDRFFELNIGDSISLTGTVKEHKEYNSIKQTILNRCKIEVLKSATL